MKKILRIAAVLLIASLAFFSCDDRKYEDIGPKYKPIEIAKPKFVKDYGAVTVNDDGSISWTGSGSAGDGRVSFNDFPPGTGAYAYVIISYTSKQGEGSTEDREITMKTGSNADKDLNVPNGSGEGQCNWYPTFADKGDLVYPITAFSGKIGMQKNTWPDKGEPWSFTITKISFTNTLPTTTP